MWFSQQREPDNPLFDSRAYVDIEGAIHYPAFEAAVRRFIEEARILHFRFLETSSGPVQFEAGGDAFEPTFIDVSREDDPFAACWNAMQAESNRPYDVLSGRLFSQTLFKLGDQRHVWYQRYHHIVMDGASIPLATRRVAAIYTALMRQAPVPEADFGAIDLMMSGDRAYRSSPRYASDRQYWQDYVHALPATETIAGAAPRVSGFFNRASAPLPAAFIDQLDQIETRIAKWPLVLTAIVAAYLYRMSNGRVTVFDFPVSARSKETRALPGMFANILPMRLPITPGTTLTELTRQVSTEVFAHMKHQQFRVKEIRQMRGAFAGPVFGPRINIVPYDNRWEFDDGRATLHALANGLVNDFAVTVTGNPRDPGCTLHVDANAELYDDASVQAHRKRLLHFIEPALADPEQPIERIDLLDADERRLLLQTWNATEADYPRHRCVHELVEAQAGHMPEAIALVAGDEQLSYGELNARANRLARYLVKLGVGPDIPVAVCVERSVAMVVALLAVFKAGGAYLSIDPAYSSARLAHILDDAAPPVMLADAVGREVLGEARLAKHVMVDLSVSSAPWDDLPSDDLPPRSLGLDSSHLAYVIYTSGSTGTPKGVMVEHRQLANLVTWHIDRFELRAGSRVPATASLAFDASVWELWPVLCAGASLLLPPPGLSSDAAALLNWWRQQPMDCAFLVTPLALLAMQSELPPGLKSLLIGGDRVTSLPSGLPPSLRIVNNYGPTETTVVATSGEIEPSAGDTAYTIGKPIANTRIYLLDENQALVPLGAIGELYIGGAGVARGYLNRPDLTAQRFLADPFARAEGDAEARMYRAGDLARYQPDGNIVFLGRNDEQVKVRGFRVEPGEIEAQLATHEAVREAIVIARQDPAGNARLLAYVSLQDAAPCAELVRDLREHLAARLPEYMVPAAFVVLDALPLTPNGKVDRRALPEPDDEAFAQAQYEAPQGETEQTIAALWAELLGVERVGRHDNFFALGGHSLLAVQLIERLRQIGLTLAIRDLFEQPALAALSATLGQSREVVVPENRIGPDTRAITPDLLPLTDLSQTDIDRIVAQVPGGIANIQDIYALSPLQDGILFHHVLSTHGDPYLLSAHLAFADRAALDRYLHAISRLVERHDILRTAVLWEGLGSPVQVVLRRASVEVSELVLDGNGEAIAKQLQDRIHPARYRMDLAQAPLLRFVVAEEAGGRWQAIMLLHHLVGDHSTLAILNEEVQATIDGQAHLLPEPQPYRNLVAHARLGLPASAHEAFFSKMLGDVDTPTLPFGLALAHDDMAPVYEARRIVPVALDARLRALSRTIGVSLATMCHLAWAMVLARTSGQRQVVFGTVLFGRMAAGAGSDRTMGLYINTLPLRIDIDATDVRAAVRDTQIRLAGLLAHEHASLALAQRCSGIGANVPLFSALLNYRHNVRLDAPSQWPCDVELLEAHERTNYPVTLSVEDYGDALEFAAQVIVPELPDRICAYMQHALEQLADALDAGSGSLDHLQVVPEDERALLIDTLNATDAPYDRNQYLHGLFEAQVKRTPEAVALIAGDERLSYAELDARANRFARYLVDLGVGPDALVAVCLERSTAMVVSLLGILKAGGAYVPIDPAYPGPRIAHIVSDSAPAVVLVDATGREALVDALGDEKLAEYGLIDVSAASTPWDKLSSDPLSPNALGLNPRHLAYVIYTSGSTGMPKGVQNEHDALVNRLTWMQEAYRLGGQDVVLQKTPFSFDVSVWEFFWTLANGATLVMVEPGAHRDADYLTEIIAKHSVTTLHFVPSMLAGFLEAQDLTRCKTLSRIICSGEALPAPIARRCLERLPHARLHNLYGPTEAAIDVTAFTCPADFDAQAVPIGKPIANTRIYLLDEHQAPVPMGAIGELYIGGVGVARGYLNRADLTAQRFLADPFARAGGHPEARMYRTGDLACYLPDGNIVFLGRNDDQVKIRGFRIELGEIEVQLAKHEAVREAIVIARQDSTGNARLLAYVTPQESASREELARSLREHLTARLPDYMVPAAFVVLDTLPLTPNGKLDRRALPEPADDAFVQSRYEAPQGETEQAIAALWSDLLGIERVGRHDNFFALGGHSLLAVRMLNRLRAMQAGDLSLSSLFDHPTVSAVAQAIDSGSRSVAPPIVRVARDARLPLSFAQQRMMFLSGFDGASTIYHVPLVLRIDGKLDISALRRALDTLWARHEALRTVFLDTSGTGEGAHAELLPADDGMPWREDDLSSRLDASQDEWLRLCEEEATQAFDLARGPLVRARLVRLAANEHTLMLTLHHIICDGWSLAVLVKELGALYRAVTEERPEPLGALTIQYPDYVSWQRQWFGAERLEREAAYWKTTLAGIPTLLDLPTDHPRPAQQQFDAARLPIELDSILTQDLRRLAARRGTTVFAVVTAAWAAVLGRLAGQEDIVIGTPVANRSKPELEAVVGLFVNTLALRIDLSGMPSVGQLLDRVQSTIVAAQDHQDLPFEQVVEIVKPQRRLAHTSIFQVMISWQNTDMRTIELPDLAFTPVGGAFDRAKFDLELDLLDDGQVISGALRYATALFEEASIARHCAYLIAALRAMACDEEQPIERIDLLDADERRLLLQTWNATGADYPRHRCVHELVEDRAGQMPEAIAVVAGDEQLSYGELNARANRLARHLVKLGVGPDIPVAVCAERSVAMVVALLAVFKAGGAYLSIDPAYSSARLAHILDDAAPPVMLVDTVGREALGEACLAKHVMVDLSVSSAPWDELASDNLPPRSLGLDSSHLAYVIYTSGSTGTPKGVMVEHRQLANLVTWHIDRFELHAGSRVPATASLAFDASVWELWPVLCAGASLLLPPPGLSSDAAALLNWWRHQSMDCAFLVTPLALLAMQSELPPGLKSLLIGGDRVTSLPSGLPPSLRIVNNYGPTETTVVATSGEIEPSAGDTVYPIGKPIANTRIYLLDEHQALVPLGAVGELYIGGAGVARGYLNRPDLTAQRFLADPFARAEGDAEARMYRTGDLARYQPDGNIVFLGRNDEQVKVRGFRVEPREIETQLATHEAVREAIVIARQDPAGNARLLAYVSLQDAAPCAELVRDLREHLAARLPEYMVPAAFVVLDALPLTRNGKVDRRALPEPDDEAFVQAQYEAPQGETEQTIAVLWAELLGVERVGRHDNFFALGGHSLLATRMLARLRESFGHDVSIRTLFEAPTVSQLAPRVHTAVQSDALAMLLPIQTLGSKPPLFCIHPAGGFSWPYAGLAHHLPDRPLYGLQARALAEADEQVESIEEMALDYVRQIRDVQPSGPYHLLGWSLGCHIAHAIATQLQLAGESVALLAMLDGYPMAEIEAISSPTEAEVMGVLMQAFSDSQQPTTAEPLTIATLKAQLARSNPMFQTISEPTFASIVRQFQIAPALAGMFAPEIFHGDVLFLRAVLSQADAYPQREVSAWQPYVQGRIETHDVECLHETMMSAQALARIGPIVAAALERGLKNGEASTGSPMATENA
ncbi:amino acid adenylation domain-containing protein [Burkholderia gladioli]|uniref:non-ribosomal peptide synthetase n=1 Tax=Burkholderia gladioli TaxID=28095 RepID=UPI001C243BF3|nr:amino acid adenylation domain-containing protein [Burkholderia gladioli]